MTVSLTVIITIIIIIILLIKSSCLRCGLILPSGGLPTLSRRDLGVKSVQYFGTLLCIVHRVQAIYGGCKEPNMSIISFFNLITFATLESPSLDHPGSTVIGQRSGVGACIKKDSVVTHDELYVTHCRQFFHDGIFPRAERTSSQLIQS